MKQNIAKQKPNRFKRWFSTLMASASIFVTSTVPTFATQYQINTNLNPEDTINGFFSVVILVFKWLGGIGVIIGLGIIGINMWSGGGDGMDLRKGMFWIFGGVILFSAPILGRLFGVIL